MDDRQATKVRENRLRRVAERYGLRLHKSRVRDQKAPDFGTYWLTDVRFGGLVIGRIPYDWHSSTADLDDIEAYLSDDTSEDQ